MELTSDQYRIGHLSVTALGETPGRGTSSCDEHRPARKLCVLSPHDCVAGIKRDKNTEFGFDVPLLRRCSSRPLLASYVEHEDERGIAAGYIFHRSRTRNAKAIGPKHDPGVQRNLLSHFNVNPSAGHINTPSGYTSNLSAFIKPCQPDWLIRRYALITAKEFRRSSLHSSGEPSAESRRRHE